MTALVTAVVLLVSTVIMLMIEVRVRTDYGRMLNDRLEENLVAITRIMEQRLLRVEASTNTIAVLAPQMLSDCKSVDSLLIHAITAVDDVRGVSMVFDKNIVPIGGGYLERYACYDENGNIILDTYINGPELEKDGNWQKCFVEGLPEWGELVLSDTLSVVSYFEPLTDREGKCLGMLYSALPETYLTSFVAEYKVRKDMDISIYKSDGDAVVLPDDYILELSDEDLIERESIIGHIGWKVILSADKKIIDRGVRKAMSAIVLIFLLMFICIYLVVRFTVRYVSGPFIAEKRRTEKEKAIMENEMQLASAAQNELIPHVFPPFPDRKGLDISACLHPSRQVGGDLYDYFLHGDSLYFCIGDVSGKGVQAALFMAATHYLFRSMVAGISVAKAAGQMNSSLCADNEKCRFVTFWMGCLDLTSGDLEYVNAGHDAPMLVSGGSVGTFPSSVDVPLGVLEGVDFVPGKTKLLPGDTLLLYTDGVTESMDAGRQEFGRARLSKILETVSDADASGVIEIVLDEVRRHSSGTPQSDDITMLCIKFIGKETKNQ
ncbi:MAG: PP2C family protein-serine/threonine phosphatase [Bacteroidales bacterium]|nr:PP2C family protein-serine/threonine phosphatase [Bacteroidales bacterium]